MRPHRYWNDFANVERELRDFIDTQGQPGVMPSQTTLGVFAGPPKRCSGVKTWFFAPLFWACADHTARLCDRSTLHCAGAKP